MTELSKETIEEIRERVEASSPRVGHEAQGTGLHNAYLRDVPRLLDEIGRLSGAQRFLEDVMEVEDPSAWEDEVDGAYERAHEPGRFREKQAELWRAFNHERRLGDGDDSFWRLKTWPPGLWPAPNPGENPKAVAIVGKAYERYLAPWGRPDWEIWGLNQSDGVPPIEAHTRWFQLHPPIYLSAHSRDSLEDLEVEWIYDRGVRLVMDKAYDEYPNSEPFPKEEVEALTPHGEYHTSSFDWMLAQAILEGFEHIELYGCQFFSAPPYNGEPISARSTLEYWAGVAEGRGATVRNVTFGGDVFKTIHLARLRSDLQYGFGREPALELEESTGFPWKDLR